MGRKSIAVRILDISPEEWAEYAYKRKRFYQSGKKEFADEVREMQRRYVKKRREQRKLWMAKRTRPSLCEVCGRSDVIVFDHCHQTNKFRGWICKKCNGVLGYVDDNVEILKKLIAYLEKFNVPVD